MHELLLYGQIPAARHEQLLNILTGLSAMQPAAQTEHHVLFRPTSLPAQNNGPARGGSQGVAAAKVGSAAAEKARNANSDVFFVRLVKSLEDEGGEGKWKFVFQETPVPGKRATILRSCQETEVMGGDARGWVEALGYTHQSETITTGHFFILNNTILHLHRTLILPPSTPIQPLSSLQPLDKSGTYLLEAKIRIAEASPSLVAKAERELLDFAARMKGVLELVVPERLALDTRYLAQRPRLQVDLQKQKAMGRV